MMKFDNDYMEKNMIVTIEHEIQIDEYKYIPYMKITKYYSDVPSIKKALVIDFENESLEIHKNKTGTSLFNIMPYDIPMDIIKSGLELFNREKIMEFAKKNIDQKLTFWLQIKFYDLDGHKHIFNLNPMEKNNPIIPILKWIKEEYYGFIEIQEFFNDI